MIHTKHIFSPFSPFSPSLLVGLAFAAPFASHAQLTLRPTSPLATPTFTCANAPEPVVTPGALKNPGLALSTTATSVADRGNQQRWAYAFNPATPGSHTIPQAVAGSTEQIPRSYTVAGNVAPTDLSSLSAMAWQHFSGREVFAYSGGTAAAPQLATGQSLGSVGFYLSNPNGGAPANQTRFFQFQFHLAPEVNPSTYRLTLNGATADDQVIKYYVNGVAWPTTAMPLGGGATPDQQWRTGLNTITVAIYDTNPSATRLIVAGATSSDCAVDMQTLAVTVAVQNPVISPAQTETFTGVATATPGAGGAAAPMPAGTSVTLVLTGPNGFSATQATTVPGNDGQYSVVWPAGLAPGSYTVVASLTDQPSIQSAQGSFMVVVDTFAITVAVQNPVISPAQTQTFTGLATATPGAGGAAAPMPAGTPITLTLTGPNGFTATQATTVPGADGQYSVVWPAGLATGDYTVIASLTAQPSTQSTVGTFVVRADVPVVPSVVQPVPTLSQWSLLALSALLALMGMGQKRQRKN